jgi:hypothetical protein
VGAYWLPGKAGHVRHDPTVRRVMSGTAVAANPVVSWGIASAGVRMVAGSVRWSHDRRGDLIAWIGDLIARIDPDATGAALAEPGVRGRPHADGHHYVQDGQRHPYTGRDGVQQGDRPLPGDHRPPTPLPRERPA